MIKKMPTMRNINVEGLILPNEPLTNFQLIDAAKKLKLKHFKGVFVRDELPKKPSKKECGIVNTGDSSTNGFHWVCWYKDGDEKYSFDSYGQPPLVELDHYLKGSVNYNSERVQFGNTSYCGHLCLYVLKKLQDGSSRQEGVDFQSVINTLW